MKALESRLADDQVAGQVVAKAGQRLERVVGAPVARISRQPQRRVSVGKGAAHEALRAHVVQKPGQAGVQLAHAIGLIDPETPARQRHDAAKRRDLPARIDAHHRQFAPCARNVARQQVTPRPRRAGLAHVACRQQRRECARHGRLAHAQARLQFEAGGDAALRAQCSQQGVSQGVGRHQAVFE